MDFILHRAHTKIVQNRALSQFGEFDHVLAGLQRVRMNFDEIRRAMLVELKNLRMIFWREKYNKKEKQTKYEMEQERPHKNHIGFKSSVSNNKVKFPNKHAEKRNSSGQVDTQISNPHKPRLQQSEQ
jgi:hypothetical protein